MTTYEQAVKIAEILDSKLGQDRSNSWILLDYTDVIVNVFNEEARNFYDLERLWQDGKEVDLSDILKD